MQLSQRHHSARRAVARRSQGSAASDPKLASEQLALSRCLPQVVQMVHERSCRGSTLAFYAMHRKQSLPMGYATAFASAQHARSEHLGEVTPETSPRAVAAPPVNRGSQHRPAENSPEFAGFGCVLRVTPPGHARSAPSQGPNSRSASDIRTFDFVLRTRGGSDGSRAVHSQKDALPKSRGSARETKKNVPSRAFSADMWNWSRRRPMHGIIAGISPSCGLATGHRKPCTAPSKNWHPVRIPGAGKTCGMQTTELPCKDRPVLAGAGTRSRSQNRGGARSYRGHWP